MKALTRIAAVVGACLIGPYCCGQSPCGIDLRASVSLAGAEFSLADILAPNSCPELVKAAEHISLGRAPLLGSVRVVEAQRVRQLLSELAQESFSNRDVFLPRILPERIIVRREENHSSCEEVLQSLLSQNSGRRESTPAGRENRFSIDQELLRHNVDCAGVENNARFSPLAITRDVWDPALRSRLLFVRCLRAGVCAPFVVRMRSTRPDVNAGRRTRVKLSSDSDMRTVVRPGQRATLLWEADGVRSMVPVVCLDKAGPGEMVHVRLAGQANKVVTGIVLSPTLVRKVS